MRGECSEVTPRAHESPLISWEMGDVLLPRSESDKECAV